MESVTRRRVSICLLLLICFAGPLFSAKKKKPRRKLTPKLSGPTTVIADVSVIDVLTGLIAVHQDVSMQGDKISAIRPAKAREKTVRYVIPGLWDMHVHLWYSENQFADYLSHGVTGVRNMGADLKQVRKWQAEIAHGELIGPRIFTSGSAISTSPAAKGSRLPVVVVHTPAEARSAFDKFYKEEVNFIKVIDMPEGAFEAIAEESRHDGVPIAGHLPLSVSAFTAAQDRMSSIEHLFGIPLACSSEEEALRNRALTQGNGDPEAASALAAEILDTFDPATAKRLFEEFRRFNVRQTPTLTLWSRMNHVGSEDWPKDPETKHVSAAIRKDWKRPDEEWKDLTERDKSLLARQYENAFRLTGMMAKAGVPILAGTDTGDPWTVPGAELHKELELLVKAGLTPAQALRSATTEPASLMRKPSELGQVKVGFAADLVVLDANPLASITNTKKIRSVYLRGKKIDLSGR